MFTDPSTAKRASVEWNNWSSSGSSHLHRPPNWTYRIRPSPPDPCITDSFWSPWSSNSVMLPIWTYHFRPSTAKQLGYFLLFFLFFSFFSNLPYCLLTCLFPLSYSRIQSPAVGRFPVRLWSCREGKQTLRFLSDNRRRKAGESVRLPPKGAVDVTTTTGGKTLPGDRMLKCGGFWSNIVLTIVGYETRE